MVAFMRRVRRAIMAVLTALLLQGLPALAGDRPVVVELFTSQGCSSCPPAEAYLRDLAKRPDVIALEFHVDYWDYIGWKDRFAKHDFTERQEGYVGSLKGRYKYTPQMVIGGVSHVVGSKRAAVVAEIARRRAARGDGPALTLSMEGDTMVARIAAGSADGAYDIVLLTFDREHTTDVERGENSGRQLTNAHVVREYEKLGSWTGDAVERRVPMTGRAGNGGCAVLVQKQGYGEIVAAASLPLWR